MAPLMKSCMKTAAVLAMVAAASGCKKKEEYGSTGTASPGTSTYTSPQSDTYGSATTGTPTQVSVEVIRVDEKAPSITVTEATTGPTAERPGTEAEKETGANQGSRGTAGAIADRRTLPVDAAAIDMLSHVKVGDRVTITCSMMGGTGTTGTGTGTGRTAGSTGMGTMGTGMMGGLENCTSVASITPETGSSGRGR